MALVDVMGKPRARDGGAVGAGQVGRSLCRAMEDKAAFSYGGVGGMDESERKLPNARSDVG